jgi:NAD(P)H-hydrate epimerase
MGVISPGAVEVLKEEVSSYQALLLGPGLTQEDATVDFVHDLLGLTRGQRRGQLGFVARSGAGEQQVPELPPLVIDADGINALAGAAEWWAALPSHTIITPHPGEMARLTGGDFATAEIQADREGLARRFAAEWGVVLVLKGAFTVIAAPDGRCLVLPFANPGLATAGSGDVLAGAVVGLRAQGLDAFEAAAAGAYLHGLAGELARLEVGSVGIVAGDLAPRFPRALQLVRDGC